MTPARLFVSSFRRRSGDSLLLAGALAVDVFVVALFLSIAFAPESASLARRATIRYFFIACALLTAVFSCFFTWFVAGYFIQKRKREISTWILLGMKKRTAFAFSAGELAVAAIAALVVGISTAGVLGRFFSIVLGFLIKAGGRIEIPLSSGAVGYTAALGAVQILAAVSRVALDIRRSTIAELFVSECRTDALPRTGAPYVASGLVLIAAAYSTAALCTAYYAVYLMIPVLAAAVSGSFLFLAGLVPWLSLRFRRVPGCASPLLLIASAQLSFRHRRNARILALISVLVGVAATAGATMFCLASSGAIQTDRLNPNDAELVCPDPAVFDAAVARATSAFSAAGVPAFRIAESFPVRISYDGAEAGVDADAISLSSWLNLMAESGRPYLGVVPEDSVVVTGYLVSIFPALSGTRAAVRRAESTFQGQLLIVPEGHALALLDSLHQVVIPDTEWSRLAGSGPVSRIAVWNADGADLTAAPIFPDGVRFALRSESVRNYSRESGALMFIGAALTVAFLFAALSSAAFKLLEDARDDRIRFRLLRVIGMGARDVRRVVSIQVGLSFALPFILGSLDTIFALKMLGTLTRFRVAGPTFVALAATAAAFGLFYLYIVDRYDRIAIRE